MELWCFGLILQLQDLGTCGPFVQQLNLLKKIKVLQWSSQSSDLDLTDMLWQESCAYVKACKPYLKDLTWSSVVKKMPCEEQLVCNMMFRGKMSCTVSPRKRRGITACRKWFTEIWSLVFTSGCQEPQAAGTAKVYQQVFFHLNFWWLFLLCLMIKSDSQRYS